MSHADGHPRVGLERVLEPGIHEQVAGRARGRAAERRPRARASAAASQRAARASGVAGHAVVPFGGAAEATKARCDAPRVSEAGVAKVKRSVVRRPGPGGRRRGRRRRGPPRRAVAGAGRAPIESRPGASRAAPRGVPRVRVVLHLRPARPGRPLRAAGGARRGAPPARACCSAATSRRTRRATTACARQRRLPAGVPRRVRAPRARGRAGGRAAAADGQRRLGRQPRRARGATTATLWRVAARARGRRSTACAVAGLVVGADHAVRHQGLGALGGRRRRSARRASTGWRSRAGGLEPRPLRSRRGARRRSPRRSRSWPRAAAAGRRSTCCTRRRATRAAT